MCADASQGWLRDLLSHSSSICIPGAGAGKRCEPGREETCLHRGLGASSPGKRRTGPRWGGAPGKVQESSAPEFRGGGGSRQARELVSWWVEAGAGPLEERTPMLAMPGFG